MAVQGKNRQFASLSSSGGLPQRLRRKEVVAFWVAGFVAAALSLAAALVALFGANDGNVDPRPSAAADLAARNERIAFFEVRARNDNLDFLSLNVLSREYLQRARETGDIDDYARADLASERALALVPDNHSSVAQRAAVKLAQHDFAAALGLADQTIALKPKDPTGYGLRGDAYVALGRYDEASRDFQSMVSLEPDFAALSRLADLAFLQNDLLNAEDFWKQALDRARVLPVENEAWARAQLGGLYFNRGDLKKAEGQYNAALKTYPDYVHALAGLGNVRAAQDRWDEAIALLTAVQGRRPEPQYVIALGDVYAAAGHRDDAQRQYALVGVIDQLYRANGINTDLALALFYADHDRELPKALEMAQNAYAASRGIYATDSLAWALYKNGRLDEAAARSAEALRLKTPDARLYFHAGMIAAARGQHADAIVHLEMALKLNPNFSLLQAETARQTLAAAKAAQTGSPK